MDINIQTARPRLFSEQPTDFTCFDEAAGIRPLPPAQALAYFRGLVPSLDVTPGRFGPRLERQAFTLAEATEQTLLEEIQQVIADRLESGRGIKAAPRNIDEILEEAGIHPRNPQYAEQVFRTNLLDSYNTGAQREMEGMAEYFPAWRYAGIEDGREGEDHKPWFGKVFSAEVPFTAVRDWYIVRRGEPVHVRGKSRPYNCRCSFIPIDKNELAELKRQGVTLERWPPA